MTRKSYAQLQDDLLRLQQKYLAMSTDPDTGLQTYHAFRLDCMELQPRARFMFFVRIIGDYNPSAVKRALYTRSAGAFYRAHGSESGCFVFLFEDGEAMDKFGADICESLNKAGAAFVALPCRVYENLLLLEDEGRRRSYQTITRSVSHE